MAARAKKASAFNLSTGLSSGDRVIAVANIASVVNSAVVTVDNLLANSNVPIATTGNNSLSTANLVITSSAPASSGANGVAGQIKWDGNFVYVCVATNTWKRTALSTF